MLPRLIICFMAGFIYAKNSYTINDLIVEGVESCSDYLFKDN